MAHARPARPHAAVAICLALVLGIGSGASAFGDDDVDKRITQSKSEIDDLSKELTAADAKMKRTDAQVASAHTALLAAKRALTAAQQKQTDAKSAHDLARADEKATTGALAENEAAQQKARTEVGGIARNAFESGGLGELTFTIQVLTAKTDVTGSMALADIVMRRQQATITDLESSAAAGRAEAARLAEVRRRASLARARQDAAVASADAATRDAAAAEQRLSALRADQDADRAALAAQKKKEEAKLAALEAESARLRKVVTAKSAPLDPKVTTVTNEGGFLDAPGPSSSIVSPFGYRFHPVLKIQKLHEGNDYPFACGTPVFAAGDGTVVEANFNAVSGNHVYISHGTVNGVPLTSAYMHFTSLLVSAGQKVKRGQQIGISGMTGRVTGCHLHFETRENGVAVNPAKWIK